MKFLGSHLFTSLGYLLGVMQVVVGHWFTVVAAGREGPGLFFGLILAAPFAFSLGSMLGREWYGRVRRRTQDDGAGVAGSRIVDVDVDVDDDQADDAI